MLSTYGNVYRRLTELSNRWFETPEGFLLVPAVIAKKAVLDYPEYGRRELLGDAIFDESFIASANGCPVTYEHPSRVDANNYEQHTVGVVIDPVVNKEAGQVEATIKLFDSDIIRLVKSGVVRELSQGYVCELHFEPGVYDGKSYDAEQKDIVLNHIALVKSGRAGKAVAVKNSRRCRVKEEEKTNEGNDYVEAGKPNPQLQSEDGGNGSDDSVEQDTQETIAKKLDMIAEALVSLEKLIVKMVNGEQESDAKDEAESDGRDEGTKEEKANSISASSLKDVVFDELLRRENALVFAKTLIGGRAEELFRQHRDAGQFAKSVLALAGMPKQRANSMSDSEALVWLEAKAQLKASSRVNTTPAYEYVNGYGDSYVTANDF